MKNTDPVVQRAYQLASPEFIAKLDLIGWTGEVAINNDRPAVLCYPDEDTDDGVFIIETIAGVAIEFEGRIEIPLTELEQFLNLAKGVGKG